MRKRFVRNRDGNFAVITALAALPFVLAIGCAVDGSRWYSAQAQLQNAADITSLALAASSEQDVGKLRENAVQFITANLVGKPAEDLQITSLEADDEMVKLRATANVKATFMSLLSYNTLPTTAYVEAKRAPIRKIEIALVLDNTYSMKGATETGETRMAVLKAAAADLVGKLLPSEGDAIRIGLVPYAEYVNVGLASRDEPWLAVEAEYSKPPSTPRTCETRTEKSVCVAWSDKYQCTKTQDGLEEESTCGGSCTKYETTTVKPYEYCTGGGSTTYYKWHGCVGSRTGTDNRLHDKYASTTYPGLVDTTQRCGSPMIELTSDENALLSGIGLMNYQTGSYKPLTYIPAGMIWGQNMLSDVEPFTAGDDYDPKNKDPRKVIVLMTDGENTLKYNSNGRHGNFSSKSPVQDFNKVNMETLAICDYSKSKGIEIFTVAFMVDVPAAKTMLESCATDKLHYIDASDAHKLKEAFERIASAVSDVRLAE